ncbi:MAG: glycosyltransferase [Candidatus Kapaibacterium sp.]|nr:UDP-glucosyltransferase [Bacteroidota bacterium]
MHTKHPLRIVNYAVNGLGLGHITRLTAISRELRRIATVAGIATEITFLTSSESDAICYANGFASFKIPSKNSITRSRIAPHRYRKIAKQWIWNAVNVLAPDILVVDTFPAGSFNELYDVLDFGQKNVFIYRAVKPEVAEQSAFQSVLRGYHAIIKPTEHGVNPSPVPEECFARVTDVGEILIRSRSEILSRNEARRILDIPSDATVVYCTIGGGGDNNANELLQTFRTLAEQNPNFVFVIGAGPLYRGVELHAPNIRWSQRLLMMEYFNAFDCAVTAGGFNSVNELLHCGVPCVFLPQERKYDDQFQRVEKHAQQGAGFVVPTVQAFELTQHITEVLAKRKEMSAIAQQAVPRNCASDAATEILCTTIPRTIIEEACEMLYHAQLPQRQLSQTDEHLYCEVLATLTTIARLHVSSGVSTTPEERCTLAEECLAFATGNNRTVRDVLRAARAYKRINDTSLPLRETLQQYIIQLPTETEQPTEEV